MAGLQEHGLRQIRVQVILFGFAQFGASQEIPNDKEQMHRLQERASPPITTLQLKAAEEGQQSPKRQIIAGFIAEVVNGAEPFTAEDVVAGTKACQNLLPADATVIRCHTEVDQEGAQVLFARCPRGAVLTVGSAIYTSATTQEGAESLLREVTRRAPPPEEGSIRLKLWNYGTHGPGYNSRNIEVPRWQEVTGNYPRDVAHSVGKLMAMERPAAGLSGKLIIWHGPPGTGKTTAIRALIREWSSWCAPHYIADPESFFCHADYISGVLSNSSPDNILQEIFGRPQPKPKPKYRLVIAEDCDEFIGAEARREAGAPLGRLLNLSDGILGQGSDVVILLTTNEDLQSLHRALIRPGRCLAKIEFGRFNEAEARRWLGPGIDPPGPNPTLAELYEARGEVGRIGEGKATATPVGFHL
jgi:hypothetical protein